MKPVCIQQRCATVNPAYVEWPTVTLIALYWLFFLGLTWFYHELSWWIVMPLGGYIIALFGSLQHEVLHGHPTPQQWLNETMVFPNIALWMPYPIYKTTHLTHHINHQLTDPEEDPESYYICSEKWQQHSRFTQIYYRFYNTLIGRCLCGPIHVIVRLWLTELRNITIGNNNTVRVNAISSWIIHFIACLPVLYWVVEICDISFWAYFALFVYPGIALTLLRSFAEHQAVDNAGERSIIVETNPLLSLMYLNNNLHALHHENPHLAWYRLPKVWQNSRDLILKNNGDYYFSSYLKITRHYWKSPKEHPRYPL